MKHRRSQVGRLSVLGWEVDVARDGLEESRELGLQRKSYVSERRAGEIKIQMTDLLLLFRESEPADEAQISSSNEERWSQRRRLTWPPPLPPSQSSPQAVQSHPAPLSTSLPSLEAHPSSSSTRSPPRLSVRPSWFRATTRRGSVEDSRGGHRV